MTLYKIYNPFKKNLNCKGHLCVHWKCFLTWVILPNQKLKHTAYESAKGLWLEQVSHPSLSHVVTLSDFV